MTCDRIDKSVNILRNFFQTHLFTSGLISILLTKIFIFIYFSQIDFGFEGPLQSEARVWKAAQSVLINGRVQTTLHLQCVRCLKEIVLPISSTFELTLLPLKETPSAEEAELGEEDMESNFYQGGEIHLSEIACEQIFLE